MSETIPLRERIILALDVERPELAKAWVERTEEAIGFYKVGLQLFLAGWFDTVEWIAKRGHKVMLDLKLFDIPETVKLAVRQLNGRGVCLATVHGQPPIIRAAVEAKGDVKLLAVTVLTSTGEEDLRAEGMTGTIAELVDLRARQALELGCDGVVASGHEAARLRAGLGQDFLIVTPGIRPADHNGQDDQTRVMTAGRAIANGADHVVVGRPITRAAEPLAVIRAMQAEIAAAVGKNREPHF